MNRTGWAPGWAASLVGVRRRVPDVKIHLAGEHYQSATLASAEDPYIVCVSTTIAALAHELHSAYVGHANANGTVVSHLELTPSTPPRTWVEHHNATELPVTHARARLLLDHLADLQKTLDHIAPGRVEVDVGDSALAALESAPTGR